MPMYPTPGLAISVSGVNKDAGFGTRTAGGQIVAGHAADQGINHSAGLSKIGMDSNNNPIISSRSVTAITGTGATLNWTTTVAQPNGSVRWRTASGGAWATVNETGGPLTTHTVALTGMTSGVVYEYEVTQLATNGKNQAVFQGRITAGLALGEDPQQAPQQPTAPQLGDTTGITDSQDLLAAKSAPKFEVTNLQATTPTPEEMIVTWRTGVYADGTVVYRPYDGAAATVDEGGFKRLLHSVTVRGLTPGTSYEVTVVSADAQGSTAEGGPITVTTPAA